MTAHGQFVAEWTLPLLRCPRCQDADQAALDAQDDNLVCGAGHRWPIRDGVPLFVPDEAYVGSFGFQWTRFDRVQLDDETRRESERTLTEKLGLTAADVRERTVLDVGCGMGRFSEVISRWGGRVIGVDLSRAVFSARRNLAERESVAIMQADVFNLPLQDESFDIVFSIGVLHHTPDTRAAFMQLVRLVRPGGTVGIWVYSRRLQLAHAGSELLRPLTKRLPAERLLRAIERADPVVHRLQRRFGRPFRAVLPWSAEEDPRWRVLDTFDWYSPRYQWKHSYAEVEEWFRRAGLEDVRRLDFPVSVRGVRPR